MNGQDITIPCLQGSGLERNVFLMEREPNFPQLLQYFMYEKGKVSFCGQNFLQIPNFPCQEPLPPFSTHVQYLNSLKSQFFSKIRQGSCDTNMHSESEITKTHNFILYNQNWDSNWEPWLKVKENRFFTIILMLTHIAVLTIIYLWSGAYLSLKIAGVNIFSLSFH